MKPDKNKDKGKGKGKGKGQGGETPEAPKAPSQYGVFLTSENMIFSSQAEADARVAEFTAQGIPAEVYELVSQ